MPAPNFALLTTFILKNKNPWLKMIALDFCKEKVGPALMDIQRGTISKESALEILETGYRTGIIRPSFYRTSQEKIQNLQNLTKN